MFNSKFSQSMIRNIGAPYTSQITGKNYQIVFTDEDKQMLFADSIGPDPGDILSYAGQHYLILDTGKRIDGILCAGVERVRFEGAFSRYPDSPKDQFGHNITEPVIYQTGLIYFKQEGKGKLRCIVPARYGVKVADLLTIAGETFIIRQVTKMNPGVVVLVCLDV